MKRILLFSFLLICFAGYSQDEKAKKETERLIELNRKMEGTFQIQIFDSREKPTFQLSVLDEINQKRGSTETNYIWLKSNVRILILPKNDIDKKEFKPVERVKYLSSSGN